MNINSTGNAGAAARVEYLQNLAVTVSTRMANLDGESADLAPHKGSVITESVELGGLGRVDALLGSFADRANFRTLNTFTNEGEGKKFFSAHMDLREDIYEIRQGNTNADGQIMDQEQVQIGAGVTMYRASNEAEWIVLS